nr:zinc finger CW-type PWWP domain protein 1-like [Coffea arabica]
MATPEETSRLRTLADAVSEPALSAAVGSGLAGPDKNRALSRGIPGGFDVNKVSEEAEEEEMEDSVVAVTKRTEISLVETRMTLGTGLEGTEKLGHGVALGLGSSDGKIGPANGSASVLAKSGIIEDLNADNGGNAIVKMDGETGAGDDADSIDGHGYSVGDLVWGKIKSHPWWPGQIYDPKHASDYALKFNHTGRLLVAYFGDGSFAWCQPSQLIPFAEHFEDMCKQSNSKSFVTAVQEAVDEIGRLVELEMICKCTRREQEGAS